jgi:ribosomal protein S18 acetylase RimI-like enzyme
MQLIIREIRQSEHAFLSKMLYQAIFVPRGTEPPSADIINQPDLAKYIKDFGRDGDLCLVAEFEGKLVGAAWSRLFPEQDKGYGFVDSQTPELSIAVLEQFRKMGFGEKILREILTELMRSGYSRVSLSVDKSNYACKLYERFGFKTVFSTDTSVTMVKTLS